MKIIWFSEIKWSYLRTRKQHILSKFNDSDEILFIEPISFNLKNKFNISIEKNIKYVTIPQLQNSDIKFLNYLIQFSPFKFLFKIISKLLFYRILRNTNFIPDIIITSNVFWANYLRKLKDKYNIKIIYDCNDNPLAFPNALNKSNYFRKTLDFSDYIIIPYKSYKNFIPDQFHSKINIISNGVDKKLMDYEIQEISKLKNINKIIMYIGSIDTRLDYKLINYLASELFEFNFVFIGDIKHQSQTLFKQMINKRANIIHFPSIKYDKISSYLSYAKVCIIPFLKNSLSNSILPNKIFEYSLLEKPFIMTNFNKQLSELNSDILISNTDKEFKDLIIQQSINQYDTKNLKNFALNYDWGIISKKYQDFISSIV